MAHDVFVSYSSKDKTAADMVVAALESAGVRCWVAPRDILVGQEWAGSILHAIESCRLMVLVFSDNANSSTHVRKEVERAVHHGLAIAPVRLTEALPADALEYFLSSSHWMDAIVPPLERHLAELTRKVQLLLSGETAAPPGLPGRAGPASIASRPGPPKRIGKPVVFGVVAAILLVIIAGAWVAASKLGWIGAKVGQASTSGALNGNANSSGASAGNPQNTGSAGTNQSAGVVPQNAAVQPATINVTTAEEFVQAIGPDRIIHLQASEYVLTDVTDRQMEFVRWDRKFDGKSLTLRNVKNLSIVAAGDKPARLIVRSRYVFVLKFEKCQDIRLTNLTLGHAPQRGECDCGVIGATDCTGLTFEKCDLFGCGAEGLTLDNVKRLKFVDSTIRDCSYGIASFTGCTNFAFARSRFVGNSQYWGLKIDDCKDISFSDCDIENNTLTDGSIFQVSSCTGITFEGGQIQNNHASALMEEADTVTISNAAMDNNEFKRH